MQTLGPNKVPITIKVNFDVDDSIACNKELFVVSSTAKDEHGEVMTCFDLCVWITSDFHPNLKFGVLGLGFGYVVFSPEFPLQFVIKDRIFHAIPPPRQNWVIFQNGRSRRVGDDETIREMGLHEVGLQTLKS